MRVTNRDGWPRAVFLAWLDQLMESLGVTSDNQLAQRVGIASSSVISNWRRGQTQPDVTNLRKLAIAAGVSPVEVFAKAGRLEDADIQMERRPVEPLPKAFRDLIDLYMRSDGDTRSVILGQVEFLLAGIAGRQRVR
jgi:transcriptional regulator with XRE-family HTH domain